MNVPSSFDYSHLTKTEKIEFIKDLLNLKFDHAIELGGPVAMPDIFDFSQITSDGQAEIVGFIHENGESIERQVEESLRTFSSYTYLKDTRFYQIFYSVLNEVENSRIGDITSQKDFADIDLWFLDLNWINETVVLYPKLIEQYGLDRGQNEEVKTTARPQEERASESEINETKRHPWHEHKELLQQVGNELLEQYDIEEFYFQKALDLYEELRHIHRGAPITKAAVKKGRSNQQSANDFTAVSFEEMNDIWQGYNLDEKTGIALFKKHLLGEKPELVPLYELILKFLAHLASGAYRKNELNDYDDNRTVIQSHFPPEELLRQFLFYSVNGFYYNKDYQVMAVYQATKFLTGRLDFNIGSALHRQQISDYYINDKYDPEKFNFELNLNFMSLEFNLKNRDNLTCFHTAILYDPRVKALWYQGGDEAYVHHDESDISLPFTTRTGLNNDGALGSKDLLDIENDVRSFALILASQEIKPPLAIALFGKWGSGKSFFMELLSKRVDELSIHQGFLDKGETLVEKSIDGDGEPKFCKGIAQIKFNAWSYLDANLWAGLVSSIFEKLDEYITERSKGYKEKLEIREELSKKLEILSSEKEIVNKEIEELEQQKIELENEMTEQGNAQQEYLAEIEQHTLEKMREKVMSEMDAHLASVPELAEYGITPERLKALDPRQLYQEVHSWVAFVRNFFKLSPLFMVFFGGCLILLAWLIIDPDKEISRNIGEFGKTWAAVLTIISPLFIKAYNTFIKYKKLIQPVTDYKNKFNQRFEQAEFEYQKNKELLADKIRIDQHKIENNRQKIIKINKDLDDLNYTKNHFVAQRAFNNFIKRRVNEQGYDSHIGLISIIRKDFETLSELFQEVEVDRKASEKVQRKQEQQRKDHQKMVNLFEEDKVLDRIVLYIDDLDRCSDEKVLEVIQAVHLLMAFPLFNVVVGVDQRCVNNALIFKNLLQYSQFLSIGKVEDMGIHVIAPSEYLEKIFQIPFHLNDPSDEDVKGMVHSLLEDQLALPEIQPVDKQTDSSRKEEVSEVDVEATRSVEQNQPTEIKSSEIDEVKKEELVSETETKSTENHQEVKPDDEELLVRKTIQTKDLELSSEEFDLLKQTVCLVGSVPRTIKRFINIYRIIRAHKDLTYDSEKQREEFLTVMFILALNIGDYKAEAAQVLYKLKASPDQTLGTLYEKDQNIEICKRLSAEPALADVFEFSWDSHFYKHIDLVKRFSFGRT